MPPLDTGQTTQILRLVDPLIDRSEPAPAAYPTVGAYLKAVREYRGKALPDLAATTRIRRAYLAAIEDANPGALPSRPFAIGYVRSYAQALEVDGEAAAERYKAEFPDAAEPLRAPIGVKHEKRERRPLFFALAALVVAVVGWNVVQRTVTAEKDTTPPSVPVAPAAEEAPTPQGPIALGAPTPPPSEQTTPQTYVTPGLGLNGGAAPATIPTKPGQLPLPAPEPALAAMAPVVFTPKGEVYGAAPNGPAVVLQARKPESLIIRGPAGQVYFARQLAAGEAYRAPIGQKLTAEVTDPAGFSVYINNQLRGALLVTQTPLDKVAIEIVAHAPAE